MPTLDQLWDELRELLCDRTETRRRLDYLERDIKALRVVIERVRREEEA